MSEIYVTGVGAVSPAGWSVNALRDLVAKGQCLPSEPLEPAAGLPALKVLRVPPPNPRPSFLAHARLRRASPISHFALSAVLEALGNGVDRSAHAGTAVIACVFSGCVNYSRRFYGETLKDPATASPLLFPETVFNAPASHISAFLGSSAINYTLVGDFGTVLTGLALGARWLLEGKAEQCVVVGTEEIDWLTAGALQLFDRSSCLTEGAGAVLLTRTPRQPAARLAMITDEFLYSRWGRTGALAKMNGEVGESAAQTVLFDSTTGAPRLSREEAQLWSGWNGSRVAVKQLLGEGLMASAAWQLVLAADAIATGTAKESIISIAGFHQHAVGARLSAVDATSALLTENE